MMKAMELRWDNRIILLRKTNLILSGVKIETFQIIHKVNVHVN